MNSFRSSAVSGCFITAVLVSTAMSCNPPVKSTLNRPPTAEELAELWMEPKDLERRDLFYGVGGAKLAPASGSTFKFKAKDTAGYSPGYEVVDANGLGWSVKQGDEAQTEVVASRLYWAVGYHQPPTYFLPEWKLDGGDVATPYSARFRPDLPQWKVAGDWDLHKNPFVSTQPYRGLLVLHVIVNSWDVKPAQNKVYEATQPEVRPRRMFLVRDLGATFGRARWPDGSRNNPDHYEKHPFITKVSGRRVEFGYSGRHDELLRTLTTADVCWTSRLLSRLSADQKRDAFRAAHYPERTAGRFIARLDQKINEGLKLCGTR